MFSLPESRFLIVKRQIISFVNNLIGGLFRSFVEYSSIRIICHVNSLNISICVFCSFFSLVVLRFVNSQLGDLDWTNIFDI